MLRFTARRTGARLEGLAGLNLEEPNTIREGTWYRASWRQAATKGRSPAGNEDGLALRRLLRSGVAAVFGDDEMHRNVVWQRMDRDDRRHSKADADHQRFACHGCECPVIVPTSIAEPIAGRIESDDGRHDDVRLNVDTIGRHRNVPDPGDHRAAWPPGAEQERGVSFDDPGQRALRSARMDPSHPRTKIGLTAKRPVDADPQSLNVTQGVSQMAGDRCRTAAPLIGRQCQSLGDDALPLCPSPQHDCVAVRGARFDGMINHVGAAASLACFWHCRRTQLSGIQSPRHPVFTEEFVRMQRRHAAVAAHRLVRGSVPVSAPADAFGMRGMDRELLDDDAVQPCRASNCKNRTSFSSWMWLARSSANRRTPI